MGFVSGTPIVTPAQVASILHEPLLANLDDAADANATISNLCTAATDYLIRELKKRGADPSKVTNTTDFQELAARWVRATAFEGQPQNEETTKKAETDRTWLAREIREIVVEETGAGTDQATQGPRGPVVMNWDNEGNFATGFDNFYPGRFGPYQNKPE